MKATVLVWLDDARPYHEAVEARGLADKVEILSLAEDETPTPELLSRLDAILGWRCPPGLLPKAERLRWIQTLSAGVERWLALPDLPDHVLLTCARGTHRIQMPENILGSLFLVTRNFPQILEDQRGRHWGEWVSLPLDGKVLGILGLGTIGREVALKANALGMRVIGTKRIAADLPAVERVYPPEKFETVLREADFVLLLLPVTPETREIMNAGTLRLMKPSAWLLNFARGALVVDEDLVAAVKGGTIRGAVLDVFRKEPLPREHPFWTTPNIFVLPHIGGDHPERDRLTAGLFAENLGRFLRGAPLLHVVSRERGY
jgi:phosphoglycerate dehydrogenase-like enzyme